MRKPNANPNDAIPPAKAAKAATATGTISSFSEISRGASIFPSTETEVASLCAQCRARPRLGALTGAPLASKPLLKSTANPGSQQRRRKVSRRAERQAALERLGDVFLEFASSPEGVKFLESQQTELLAPRNDPEYQKALQDRDKDRETVANEITAICHAVVWGKSRIGLCLKNDRDHASARAVASKLQGLFEAELLYSPDPHDQAQFADRTQKQPAKHTFGREKRSLGRDIKKTAQGKADSTSGACRSARKRPSS